MKGRRGEPTTTACYWCGKQLVSWGTSHPKKWCSAACESKARYWRDPAREAERKRRWRLENPERWRAGYMKWNRSPNRALTPAEATRKWRQDHPELYRERSHAYTAARRARLLSVPYEPVNRKKVWDRDGGICGVCSEPADPKAWHLDHIIPISRGGPHTYANVQVTHPFCNRSKSDSIPVEAMRDGSSD